MSRKTEESYLNVFKYIDSNIISLNCKSFMTDYEVAMRNAIKSVSKNAQLYTCWFHFCQACRRYVSGITGFLIALRSNQKLRKIFNKFLSIPLLPPQNIPEAFDIVCAEANKEDPKLFKIFIKYFQKQWLKKVNIFIMSEFQF